MGRDADLPRAVAVPMRVNRLGGKSFLTGAKGASRESGPGALAILLNHPVLGYGISAQFHASSKDNLRLLTKGEPVTRVYSV